MNRKTPWQAWVFGMACVIASVVNLALPKPAAFTQSDGVYNINKLVERQHWIESAPIVLRNHFATVDVYRLGNAKTDGVSFSRDLVRIFRVRHIDNSAPLDVRPLKKWSKLAPYVQYSTNAGCEINKHSGICTLHLVWDDTNSSPNREFVNARIGLNSFALIDSNLMRNVLGVNSW